MKIICNEGFYLLKPKNRTDLLDFQTLSKSMLTPYRDGFYCYVGEAAFPLQTIKGIPWTNNVSTPIIPVITYESNFIFDLFKKNELCYDLSTGNIVYRVTCKQYYNNTLGDYLGQDKTQQYHYTNILQCGTLYEPSFNFEGYWESNVFTVIFNGNK
jgi:hypothetical protein